MFHFFSKRSKSERLQKKFEKLMQRSYELSSVDRKESDRIYALAQQLLVEIDALKTG